MYSVYSFHAALHKTLARASLTPLLGSIIIPTNFLTCFMSYYIPSTTCTSMPSSLPNLTQFSLFLNESHPLSPTRNSSFFVFVVVLFGFIYLFALIGLCSSTKFILILFFFCCLFAYQSTRCYINFLKEERICFTSCTQHSVIYLTVAQ